MLISAVILFSVSSLYASDYKKKFSVKQIHLSVIPERIFQLSTQSSMTNPVKGRIKQYLLYSGETQIKNIQLLFSNLKLIRVRDI